MFFLFLKHLLFIHCVEYCVLYEKEAAFKPHQREPPFKVMHNRTWSNFW